MANQSKFARISNMATEKDLYMDTDSGEEISIIVAASVAFL
jgi:hypothetical protein